MTSLKYYNIIYHSKMFYNQCPWALIPIEPDVKKLLHNL
jgi:hypothetical protein